MHGDILFAASYWESRRCASPAAAFWCVSKVTGVTVPLWNMQIRFANLWRAALRVSTPGWHLFYILNPVAAGRSHPAAFLLLCLGHFPFALRTIRRMVMAATVRFSFWAIKGLSIFDSSNAKSCASSSGVHRRLMGRGPRLISLSPSPRFAPWPT
jgi:hypothetical protein